MITAPLLNSAFLVAISAIVAIPLSIALGVLDGRQA